MTHRLQIWSALPLIKDNDFTPTNDPALSLGTDTQLYFTVDSDGDGVIDNNDSERFGFRVNTGRLETATISAVNFAEGRVRRRKITG